MSARFEEPSIPPRLRRPLAAVWISLGLHAALIALVQIVPPAGIDIEEPAIEARLAPMPPATVAQKSSPVVQKAPLVPSFVPEAVPVIRPTALPPAPPGTPSPSTTPPTTGMPDDAPPPAAPAAPAVAPTPSAVPVPAAALTSSVDLTYYRARDLDVQPQALRTIRPDYPAEADRQRLSGTLRLQLKLEADGRVSDIEVVSATPPGVFEDSAIQAFRDARFAPAQKNGRPVRALVVIEVVYDWAGQLR
ncbi:energy transducer TonB [Thiobacillus sp.]